MTVFFKISLNMTGSHGRSFLVGRSWTSWTVMDGHGRLLTVMDGHGRSWTLMDAHGRWVDATVTLGGRDGHAGWTLGGRDGTKIDIFLT